MRKIISLSLGVTLASTVFVAVPASAEPAAVVRDHRDCTMPGAGPDGEFVVGGTGEMTHSVQNVNYAKTTCKGEGLVNRSGRTQHYSGFDCYVYLPGDDGYELTTDSHATVTRQGNATMTCKVSFGTD